MGKFSLDTNGYTKERPNHFPNFYDDFFANRGMTKFPPPKYATASKYIPMFILEMPRCIWIKVNTQSMSVGYLKPIKRDPEGYFGAVA